MDWNLYHCADGLHSILKAHIAAVAGTVVGSVELREGTGYYEDSSYLSAMLIEDSYATAA